jgi:hypothetical protein
LESIHDYIQWLFPLATRSNAQPGAPVLTSLEIEAIRADERALRNLHRASARMLGFYERTRWWLSWSDHNHLRISRILQSLRVLAGEEAARAFYEAIMRLHHEGGSPISPANLRYWAKAIEPDPA